jgi:hypothetical protein
MDGSEHVILRARAGKKGKLRADREGRLYVLGVRVS